MKAYTTRVGEGPLPTESTELSKLLHGLGREYGATTARKRRCGWFDAVATRHASMVNGIGEMAVTNLDGLDSLERVRVCTGYRYRSETFDYVPNDLEVLSNCEAVYTDFPGWQRPTHDCKTWKELPLRARQYLKAIAELSGTKLRLISVGPERNQTIAV